jgi:hypothetical protein
VKATDSIEKIQSKLKKLKDSLKGRGLILEVLRKKKELMGELAILELMEEDNILSGDQYAKKGKFSLFS